MRRRPVILILICSMFFHGCATQKIAVPAGTDSSQFPEKIANQGQTDSPADAQPAEQTVDSRCVQWSLTTVGVIGAVVVVAAVLVVYGLAKGNGSTSSL